MNVLHTRDAATAPRSLSAGRAARTLAEAVDGYRRWVSPLFPARCRYYPSCSAYAATALRRHGALSGARLAVWRLLRCHPWTPGGHDPVPERRSATISPPVPTSPTSA